MDRTKHDLLKQISILEDELQRVIREKEHEFRYTWSNRESPGFATYSRKIETVRCDFADVKSPAPAAQLPPAPPTS